MPPTATKYTQDNRSLQLATPLGKDVLLLEAFTGSESVSGLFRFRLDLLAEAPDKVVFDKLLGQAVTITVLLPSAKKRYFSGIVSQLSQGGRVAAAKKDTTFIRYRADVVPAFWFFKKKQQSRIFQQLSVPDILKKVLADIDVAYQIQGTFDPRDYCVQYRESDFDFASRLMEEEGIYYFFKHTSGGHQMVVANTPQGHPDVPEAATVSFEEGGEHRVATWEKIQEVRSGKYTLWDHCFEMPEKNLAAEKAIQATAKAGTVSHQLKVGGNDRFEIYDYPGGYANRFDGVAPGGGDQPGKLQKIFQDNLRTVTVRMQQETMPGLTIVGDSDCRQFTTGHKFTLERHFNANGSYVLTRLEHKAVMRGAYTSGGKVSLDYSNRFQCLPLDVPFRPERGTPRPVVHGTQTAVVVGPKGQEIFTDKYSRVKVQFFWDREGKLDANSSCWVRVGTVWAGKQWGAIHIPRIGQEVIVAFMEGDPDQPIVVGSVYNAEQMPPYTLPDNMTQSGLKTRSTTEGAAENFNELRFEDKKDSEEIYFHAEKDFNRVVENNDTLKVGSDKADDGSQTIEIWKNRTETLKEGDEKVTLEKGSRTHSIKKDDTLTVEGKQTITITGDRKVEVKANDSTKVQSASATEAGTSIELKVGSNSIKIDSSGVTIKATKITLQGVVEVSGQSCTISSGKISIG